MSDEHRSAASDERPPRHAARARAVRVERDGVVAIVTIDRPKALNALSPEVLLRARRRVRGARASARRGPRRARSSAPAVARSWRAPTSARSHRSRPRRAPRRARLGHRVAGLIESLPAPVIACVDGFALGGGLELALACDFIYATDASGFGQPEVRLGLIPGFGGTVRLPRRSVLALAKELIYTGRRIDAAAAESAGLVARRFPDRESLLAGARETVAEVAANAWTAVAHRQARARRGIRHPDRTAVELEVAGFEDAFRTEDMREGVAAFLEKREPASGALRHGDQARGRDAPGPAYRRRAGRQPVTCAYSQARPSNRTPSAPYISKWRCGPVDWPVEPTAPSCWPAVTRCPTETCTEPS